MHYEIAATKGGETATVTIASGEGDSADFDVTRLVRDALAVAGYATTLHHIEVRRAAVLGMHKF